MDGYRLIMKIRLGRQGGDVAPYVREQWKCTELCLGMGEEPVKSRESY